MTSRPIATIDKGNLTPVLRQYAINNVRPVTLRHIDKFGSDISHRAFLIDEVTHGHIRRYRKIVFCLYQMVVAIQYSRYIRHIRNHGENVMKLELMERNRYILQGCKVFIVGINLQSHAISRLQFKIGRHSSVVTQEHIVAVIDDKRLVTQNRMRVGHTETNAPMFHCCKQGKVYSKFIISIIKLCPQIGTMLIQPPVSNSMEHILRIFLVIDNLSLIDKLVMIRANMEPDGIQQYTVYNE